MARATKERLALDAQRLGLNKPKPGKHDATPCVSCGRPLGMHTRTEIHDCAMERS